ncbi:Adaptive-response sensory-kinase SasA [Marinomonas aquimarina]|uniref:histidine kinase n=1 Tax=Marinomonas aquimarina TaxID=295068 RepID=A0A1A8TDH4_9GAMM|nr:sensor histidine kinase [Marinomonas aquimarina]SBS31224.1 Adaptive-response sensory-kinase SasA [Marinomonas aquimarina]
MPKDNQLPFRNIISASVKDMRNSLGQVLYKLDTLMAHHLKDEDKYDLVDAQYEMVRMQNVINQLHGLYLIETDSLTVQPQDSYVMELIEDILASFEALLENKQIDVTVRGDDLSWYLDPQLISSVLQIILLNAIRYTNDEINIELASVEQGLMISVVDNGQGYPDAVLDSFANLVSGQTLANVSSQNSGWLYCEKVANQHKNQGHVGFTKLRNDAATGGGRIDLFIP